MKCRDGLGSRMKEHFRLMEPDGESPSSLSLEIITNRVTANGRFAMLLEVDAENQEKRLQLKKEKELLRKAQEWLKGLTEDTVPDHHDTL